MSRQLSHKEHGSPVKSFPIIILTDNLMGEANIGSLFRLADAFNIEKIVFCGSPVNLESNRLKRTARSTVGNVPNEFWENSQDALQHYIGLSYKPVALELTSDSSFLGSLSFQDEMKILLIAGNERHGISQELLTKIELKVHINMFGKNSSMNVSQAIGIALYEITKTLPAFAEK